MAKLTDNSYNDKVKKYESIIEESKQKIAKAKEEMEQLKDKRQKELIKEINAVGIPLEDLLRLAECLKDNGVSADEVIELVSSGSTDTSENKENIKAPEQPHSETSETDDVLNKMMEQYGS